MLLNLFILSLIGPLCFIRPSNVSMVKFSPLNFIYLSSKFLTILKNSGLPNLKFGKKIDFEELYKARLN